MLSFYLFPFIFLTDLSVAPAFITVNIKNSILSILRLVSFYI